MGLPTVKRTFFQRLLGIPATPRPADVACWTYVAGKVTVSLERAPELAGPRGALRLEGAELPERVLVFRDEAGIPHAVQNRCSHVGRRLDPVPGCELVQCCSLGKSTYRYDGVSVSGPGGHGIRALAVTESDGRLTIDLGLSPEELAAGGQP
ncbi:MAG: Rieske 2Fe-2S domain-containing protein [Candidatus Latescibacterota bacterium]